MVTDTDEVMRVRISQNLRRLLAKRGLNVRDLVGLSHEPHNTVYRIVRGDNTPSVATLSALARALDTTIDYLISENLPE